MLHVSWDDACKETVRVGSTAVTVDALLRGCLGLEVPEGLDARQLHRLGEQLVRGGLPAVQGAVCSDGWVQLGLEHAAGPQPIEIYARLSTLAQMLLDRGRIEGFFFMHKPPGMRVRFQLGAADRSSTTAMIRAELEAAVAAGCLASVQPGIYEPETRLFGGPRSMEHVHRLFTHDALMWLRFHALASEDRALAEHAWSLSLVVLRSLFTALGITDWEDVDVWDRVRSRAGRSFPAEVRARIELDRIARELQQAWASPDRLLAELPEPLGDLARAYQPLVADEAARWRQRYFASGQACLGPRAAAALFVIFHWNRGGISSTRQALLTESLCHRTTM